MARLTRGEDQVIPGTARGAKLVLKAPLPLAVAVATWLSVWSQPTVMPSLTRNPVPETVIVVPAPPEPGLRLRPKGTVKLTEALLLPSVATT